MVNKNDRRRQLEKDLPLDFISRDLSGPDPDQRQHNLRRRFADSLTQRLSECRAGNPTKNNYYPEEFEDICYELIRLTFKDEFHQCRPSSQQRSISIKGEKVEVLDLSLLIKPEYPHGGSIWKKFESHHGSEKLVFECKNYPRSHKISEGEIYQVYGYLSPKMSRVGFILNKYGLSNLDNGARTAIRRVFQDGYVIIVLGKKELEEWLNDWADSGRVEQFFSCKYDDFLTLYSN